MRYKTAFSGKEVIIGRENSSDQFIFAVESSCDETACAIVKNGREVIVNVVATQIPTHKKFGGVVPEVAAREHLEAINAVIAECFEQSGLTPDDITAFAATQGPGLVGSLLVGLNAAKTLSLVYDKPFIGVNHLKGHVCANYIGTELEPPFVALLISGGHTQILKINSYEEQEILGETLDDAIGETYDKVARLLGVSYPGGPNLDKMAKLGDKNRFKLPTPKVGEFEFSFSGLKTHMLKLTQEFKKRGEELPLNDIAASFQEAVTSILINKTAKTAKKFGINKIAVAGGVAANSEIRNKLENLKNEGFEVYAPPMKYCTDNASMIGSAAYFVDSYSSDLDVEVFSRMK